MFVKALRFRVVVALQMMWLQKLHLDDFLMMFVEAQRLKFSISSKAFCCILSHDKSLFLMLFKGSIFVAKSGIIFP